jgi:hypothetical protein
MSGKAVRETLGFLAVVGGLVMVVVEVSQNSTLVEAQLESELHSAWIEIDASKQGEDFAEVLAKAIERPQDLTLGEMVELDGYLYSYLDILWRRDALSDLGVGPALVDQVRGTIKDYFRNAFARAWWEETKFKFEDDFVALIEEEMRSVTPTQDLDMYGRISARLAQTSSQ